MWRNSQLKNVRRMIRKHSLRSSRRIIVKDDEPRRSSRLAALLTIAAAVIAGIRFIFPYLVRIWIFLTANQNSYMRMRL